MSEPIILKYTTIDRVTKTYRTNSIEDARAYVTKWIGEEFEIGSCYAISFDGIAKIIIISGSTWKELFPDHFNHTYHAVPRC